MSSPSFSRPPSTRSRSTESVPRTKGTDKADAELGATVVHDAVFGELSGGGPNYRNVS